MKEILKKATLHDFGGGNLVMPVPDSSLINPEKPSFFVAVRFDNIEDAQEFISLIENQ